MNWISINESKPNDKQVCIVRTVIQLDLFYDVDTCINESTHLCVYNQARDTFYELKTKKKITNTIYWSPV